MQLHSRGGSGSAGDDTHAHAGGSGSGGRESVRRKAHDIGGNSGGVSDSEKRTQLRLPVPSLSLDRVSQASHSGRLILGANTERGAGWHVSKGMGGGFYQHTFREPKQVVHIKPSSTRPHPPYERRRHAKEGGLKLPPVLTANLKSLSSSCSASSQEEETSAHKFAEDPFADDFSTVPTVTTLLKNVPTQAAKQKNDRRRRRKSQLRDISWKELVATNSLYTSDSLNVTQELKSVHSLDLGFQKQPQSHFHQSRIPARFHIYHLPDGTISVLTQKNEALRHCIFPTKSPASRVEAILLMRTLHSMLKEHAVQPLSPSCVRDLQSGEEFVERLQREHWIWDVVFSEAVRQVYMHCADRGHILEAIRTWVAALIPTIAALQHWQAEVLAVPAQVQNVSYEPDVRKHFHYQRLLREHTNLQASYHTLQADFDKLRRDFDASTANYQEQLRAAKNNQSKTTLRACVFAFIWAFVYTLGRQGQKLHPERCRSRVLSAVGFKGAAALRMASVLNKSAGRARLSVAARGLAAARKSPRSYKSPLSTGKSPRSTRAESAASEEQERDDEVGDEEEEEEEEEEEDYDDYDDDDIDEQVARARAAAWRNSKRRRGLDLDALARVGDMQTLQTRLDAALAQNKADLMELTQLRADMALLQAKCDSGEEAVQELWSKVQVARAKEKQKNDIIREQRGIIEVNHYAKDLQSEHVHIVATRFLEKKLQEQEEEAQEQAMKLRERIQELQATLVSAAAVQQKEHQQEMQQVIDRTTAFVQELRAAAPAKTVDEDGEAESVSPLARAQQQLVDLQEQVLESQQRLETRIMRWRAAELPFHRFPRRHVCCQTALSKPVMFEDAEDGLSFVTAQGVYKPPTPKPPAKSADPTAALEEDAEIPLGDRPEEDGGIGAAASKKTAGQASLVLETLQKPTIQRRLTMSMASSRQPLSAVPTVFRKMWALHGPQTKAKDVHYGLKSFAEFVLYWIGDGLEPGPRPKPGQGIPEVVHLFYTDQYPAEFVDTRICEMLRTLETCGSHHARLRLAANFYGLSLTDAPPPTTVAVDTAATVPVEGAPNADAASAAGLGALDVGGGANTGGVPVGARVRFPTFIFDLFTRILDEVQHSLFVNNKHASLSVALASPDPIFVLSQDVLGAIRFVLVEYVKKERPSLSAIVTNADTLLSSAFLHLRCSVNSQKRISLDFAMAYILPVLLKIVQDEQTALENRVAATPPEAEDTWEDV